MEQQASDWQAPRFEPLALTLKARHSPERLGEAGEAVQGMETNRKGYMSDLMTLLLSQLGTERGQVQVLRTMAVLMPPDTCRFLAEVADQLEVGVTAKMRIIELWERENQDRYRHAEGEARSWLMDEVIAALVQNPSTPPQERVSDDSVQAR